MRDLEPEFLILDPLRYALRAAPPKVGTSTGDEALALALVDQVSKLQDIIADLNVVLVHHLKKTQDPASGLRLRSDPRSWIEKAYGSQALLAHVDTIWGLEEDKDDYTFATVPRAQEPLMLTLEKQPGSERFLPGPPDAISFRTPAQHQVWNKLPPEFGWRDVVKAGIASNNTLNRVIRQAFAAGLLIQDPVTRWYCKTAPAP